MKMSDYDGCNADYRRKSKEPHVPTPEWCIRDRNTDKAAKKRDITCTIDISNKNRVMVKGYEHKRYEVGAHEDRPDNAENSSKTYPF